MKRMIKESTESIFASSFNRALQHLNSEPMCFITAFRKGNSNNENMRRNKELEADIKASGLTFIKSVGGYKEEDEETGELISVQEVSFCVIDNKYSPQDFKKLAISWCKKYDQDSVLITIPTRRKDDDGREFFIGIGQYYDKNGNKYGDPFSSVSMRTIEDYFTNICGKEFVLSSLDVTETDGVDVYTWSGRGAARAMFRSNYPDLFVG